MKRKCNSIQPIESDGQSKFKKSSETQYSQNALEPCAMLYFKFLKKKLSILLIINQYLQETTSVFNLITLIMLEISIAQM